MDSFTDCYEVEPIDDCKMVHRMLLILSTWKLAQKAIMYLLNYSVGTTTFSSTPPLQPLFTNLELNFLRLSLQCSLPHRHLNRVMSVDAEPKSIP